MACFPVPKVGGAAAPSALSVPTPMSEIVRSDRALVTSYRLSVVTISTFAAAWPQFSMASVEL